MFLLNLAYNMGYQSPSATAYANMICIAFYFLLWPGEYTGTTDDDAAFSLDYVRLHLGVI